MEEKVIKAKVDKVLIIVLIVSLIIIISMIVFVKSESGKCIRNPYVYGANVMKNVECSCMDFNNRFCPASFYFNSSTFVTSPQKCGSLSNYNINITK